MEDFSDEPDIADLMLVGMRKQPDTWTHLGTLTQRVVAKLAAQRQAELNAGPIPALGTGGELAKSSPLAEIALTTKTQCADALAGMTKEKPAAGSANATSGGSVVLVGGAPGPTHGPRGNRHMADDTIALTSTNEGGAAPKAGRTRSGPVRRRQGGDNPATKANVIDYREHVRLLAVWGPRGVLPRHRAVPNSYARTTSSAVRSKAKAKSSSDAPNRTATTPK